MGDGCDGVTIGGKTPVTVRFLTVTSSPPTRIVTQFQRVTGTIIKGFLGGVLSADNGAAPPPPRRVHDIFAAELLKVS